MLPAWDRYQAPAWRFFKASLLVWIVLLGMAVLGILAIAIAGLTLFNLRTPEGKLDLGVFFFLSIPCLAIVLLLLAAVVAAHVVMHDFILPAMALENLSFRKAWRVARQRINANRETFCSYCILRLGLPLLAGFFLAMAAWAVNWAVFGVLALSAQGFDAMLEDATGLGAYFRVGLEVLFRLMGLGMGLFMAFTLGGPVATWVRSYSLLFWGGHYRALGDALTIRLRCQPPFRPCPKQADHGFPSQQHRGFGSLHRLGRTRYPACSSALVGHPFPHSAGRAALAETPGRGADLCRPYAALRFHPALHLCRPGNAGARRAH